MLPSFRCSTLDNGARALPTGDQIRGSHHSNNRQLDGHICSWLCVSIHSSKSKQTWEDGKKGWLLVTFCLISLQIYLYPYGTSIFVVLCGIIWLYLYLYLPETKGRNVESITLELRERAGEVKEDLRKVWWI